MQWGVLARVIGIAIIIAIPLTIYWSPETAAAIYTFFAVTSPLWLPALLVVVAWPLWLTYVRAQYLSSISYATLELKPGDQTPKTAKPMELVLYALHHRMDISRMQAFVMGVTRVPWCFEVHASGGSVKYYIHAPEHHLAAIEGRIRSEYPDIDIDEARDYSREKPFDPFNDKLRMREYVLAKPDPYPLRTYTDHEHEKVRRDVFEELLEEVASVGADEEIWISLMVRPHQRDWGTGWLDFLEEQYDDLYEAARTEIQKLVGAAGNLASVSQNTRDLITAIEHGLQKPSFDCGLRVVYRAPREAWSDERADSLDQLFDRFGDDTFNSFEAYDPRARVTWPLSDIFAALPALDMEYFLKLYRRRAFFAPPYYGKSFVLNTEEVATLWHVPKVSRASSLSRTRGRLEPPVNLPI